MLFLKNRLFFVEICSDPSEICPISNLYHGLLSYSSSFLLPSQDMKKWPQISNTSSLGDQRVALRVVLSFQWQFLSRDPNAAQWFLGFFLLALFQRGTQQYTSVLGENERKSEGMLASILSLHGSSHLAEVMVGQGIWER